MRVLVVEDDNFNAEILRAALAKQDWAVDVVGTAAQAWAALCVEAFDVVLLDLGLPDEDGSVVLRRLRLQVMGALPDPGTPVLIMTGRDEIASRIAGLDMGADDYVTKPFDHNELAARMRAAVRRAGGRAQTVIQCAGLEIEPATRLVRRAGQALDVSPREFTLLLALAEARPQVLSRDQLEAKLYNWDQTLESNAIEVHVHHLRRKLGTSVIRTMRGVGYFIAEEPA